MLAWMIPSLTAVQDLRPNVVLIVSDDAGYGDFGFTGSLQISTPNIDSIAANGVEFTQGYVSGPVCSPSRAGLLTGRYQQRFGHEDNLAIGEIQPGDYREDVGLPVDEVTIADYLKRAGYRTGLFGKWHLGVEERFHPKNRGFDDYWFLRGGSRSYLEKTVPNVQRIESNYDSEPKVTHLTDDLGKEAARFIGKRSETPFFMFVSYTAPHTPLEPTAADEAAFDYISDNRRRRYCGLVRGLDRSVGVINRALETAGVERNTIVIFVNDNGGQIDAGAVNAPYRGMKGTFLEGGVRVAFAMKWPAVVKPGTEYGKLVSTLDILPTVLGAAGNPKIGDKKPLDGVDLKPFLAGTNSENPHESLYWRMGFTGAIREGDWKLIRMPDRGPMLFNVVRDPQEQNNLYVGEEERAADLYRKLFNWEAGMIYPRWHTAPIWYQENAARYDRPGLLVQPPGRGGQ